MATILPLAQTQFTDALGVPLAGGSVAFYMPNTTTPKTTYQDAEQTIANTNPVVLDSAGRAIIFGSGAYRQVVYDVNGNLIWDQTTSEAAVGSASFGGTSTGSANAQIVSAGTFSGADGSTINFTAGFTNTGAMTIQVGPSGSPIAVLKNGPTGPVNLVAGDIAAGNIYSISYSVSLGTFQLLQSIPPVITIASQAQAQAGTDNTTVMTPLRTNQAIQVLGIPSSLGVAQGDILYASAANTWARLSKGTPGQVFQMNAGGTAPQWATVSTGQGTLKNATGTSVSFTGISADAKVIYIMARNVSFNSADLLQLNLGTASGLVTTGYSSGLGWFSGGGSGSQLSTTGLLIAQTRSGSDACNCLATLVLLDSATNLWSVASPGFFGGSSATTGSGNVALSGALTQISLSGAGGSTFDAGTLNFAWSR